MGTGLLAASAQNNQNVKASPNVKQRPPTYLGSVVNISESSLSRDLQQPKSGTKVPSSDNISPKNSRQKVRHQKNKKTREFNGKGDRGNMDSSGHQTIDKSLENEFVKEQAKNKAGK